MSRFLVNNNNIIEYKFIITQSTLSRKVLINTVQTKTAELKKMLFSCPGQVDFPAGQVTVLISFHCHLPEWAQASGMSTRK